MKQIIIFGQKSINYLNPFYSNHYLMSSLQNEKILTSFKMVLKDLLIQLPYPLSSRLTNYIIERSGKMIRPLLTIQSAMLLNANEEQLNLVYLLGCIVEMLHNASLIHDDFLDQSPKRRGQETYPKIYGENRAISDGDLLWAFSLIHFQKFEKEWILYALDSIYTINKGNSKELEIRLNRNFGFSREDIIDIVHMKTAVVFYACINIVCMILGRKKLGKDLENCLVNAGIGFQLQDDILDISGDEEIFGKFSYWDIQESKPNLFLFYALQTDFSNKIKQVYSKPIGEKTEEDIEIVVNMFKQIEGKVREERDHFLNLSLKQLDNLSLTTFDPTEKSFLMKMKDILLTLGYRTK